MKHVEGPITKYTELLARKEIVLHHLTGKILDIGCGEGELLIKATLLGHDITGMDRSKKELEIAHATAKISNVKIKTINSDIDNMEFAPETFDVVIMGEIIEHLLDPFEDVKRVLEIIKPGGKLIITTPSGFAHFDSDHKNFFFTAIEGDILNKLWVFEILGGNFKYCKVIVVEKFFSMFGYEHTIQEMTYGNSNHPSLDFFITIKKVKQ